MSNPHNQCLHINKNWHCHTEYFCCRLQMYVTKYSIETNKIVFLAVCHSTTIATVDGFYFLSCSLNVSLNQLGILLRVLWAPVTIWKISRVENKWKFTIQFNWNHCVVAIATQSNMISTVIFVVIFSTKSIQNLYVT